MKKTNQVGHMGTRKIVSSLLAWIIVMGFWVPGVAEAAGQIETIRYVSPGGIDSGNCSNRNLPCHTIQYAVDHSIPGNEIRLASGEYTATDTPIVDIQIGLTLRGGYSISNWDVSNKTANPTSLKVSCLWDSDEAAIDARTLERVNILDLDINGCGIISTGDLLVERVTIHSGTILHSAPANTPVALRDVTINDGNFVHASGANSMATLSRIIITNSPVDGISEVSAGGLVLSDAQILNCAGVGIRFSNRAVPSSVTRTLVQENGVGVQTASAGIVTLDQVMILNNIGRGVYDRSVGMVMQSVTIQGNHAIRDEANEDEGNGAGYFTKGGGSTMTDVVIRGNIAQGNGGGVYLMSGAVKLTRSTIAENQAGQTGGGIWSLSNTTIADSAVTGNQAAAGGGGLVCHSCTLNLTNSTVSNNSTTTGYGGGLSNEAGFYSTILNSTFSGNSATVGGGVSAWYDPEKPLPSTTIRNTIIANSVTGGDCFNDVGLPLIGGSNLIEVTSTCNSIVTITSDPNLGSLSGSPAYHLLMEGSPAIDAGDNAACLTRDQRGKPRPADGDGNGSTTCDIGSVEVGFDMFLPLIVR
jgi:hypothetical protein